jgi:hypothetical protein
MQKAPGPVTVPGQSMQKQACGQLTNSNAKHRLFICAKKKKIYRNTRIANKVGILIAAILQK